MEAQELALVVAIRPPAHRAHERYFVYICFCLEKLKHSKILIFVMFLFTSFFKFT